MGNFNTLPREIDLIAQIADIKEVNYKNMLAITALIEILIEKNLINENELLNKMREIDTK